MILWMTGLSGSGKSTIAKLVSEELQKRGMVSVIIDGDVARESFSRGLGFSREDRIENMQRMASAARALRSVGSIVIVAAISPFRDVRADLRRGHPLFFEIFVDCPLATCVLRDPKGLYARAFAGQIQNFTGVTDPYEPPEDPDLRLHTDQQTEVESAAAVIQFLEAGDFISVPKPAVKKARPS
jgi:adenylylsulfate kinase